MTLPLIYALRNEHNGRIEQVQRLLASEAPGEDDVAAVVRWVNATPAIQESLEVAREYAMRAKSLLARFPSSSDRATLEEVVDFVLARSH